MCTLHITFYDCNIYKIKSLLLCLRYLNTTHVSWCKYIHFLTIHICAACTSDPTEFYVLSIVNCCMLFFYKNIFVISKNLYKYTIGGYWTYCCIRMCTKHSLSPRWASLAMLLLSNVNITLTGGSESRWYMRMCCDCYVISRMPRAHFRRMRWSETLRLTVHICKIRYCDTIIYLRESYVWLMTS